MMKQKNSSNILFQNHELPENKHRDTFQGMDSILLALSQGSLCPFVLIWLNFKNLNFSCLHGLLMLVRDPLRQTPVIHELLSPSQVPGPWNLSQAAPQPEAKSLSFPQPVQSPPTFYMRTGINFSTPLCSGQLS